MIYERDGKDMFSLRLKSMVPPVTHTTYTTTIEKQLIKSESNKFAGMLSKD